MRIRRSVLTALLALAGTANRATAQFQWKLESFQPFFQPHVGAPGYNAGFNATVLFRNVNSYADPEIIAVKNVLVRTSARVHDLCTMTRPIGMDSCTINLGPGGFGIRGNVQASTIPIAGNFWYYSPGIYEDSCGEQCAQKGFELGASGVGLLGCQGFAPTPDWYSGRTCDEDGYDGSLFMNIVFRYTTAADGPGVPPFAFEESDLGMAGWNSVWPGPNVFVHATPEPGTWLLTSTGLMFVAGAARRRARHEA